MHVKTGRFLSAFFLITVLTASAQGPARTEIRISDIPGYRTLKCDFHMHTVFSDGEVWPTVRVREAWLGGLDAIAITDHLEYRPHREDLTGGARRPYEIAKEEAAQAGLVLIRGVEITKSMPPGHINAIFVTDEAALDRRDWRDAVRAAVRQGAFVFWNHPGWSGQQPDGRARWYPEHTELADSGWIRGIEAVNEKEYYPEAFGWALDRRLALLGNSDVHDPIATAYDPCAGGRRPLTLVFAKEKSAEAIKEALFSRRTAVLFNDTLMGDSAFLGAVFRASVRAAASGRAAAGAGSLFVPVENASDLPFDLRSDGRADGFGVPSRLLVPARKTVLLEIRKPDKSWTGDKTARLRFRIANLKTSPAETLPVEWEVSVAFPE
jgi:3',5'-nucleoside bisphosphate phosphatase